MNEFEKIVNYIVKEGTNLKNKYFADLQMELDYICIFSQTKKEFEDFNKISQKIGRVVDDTKTGIVYRLNKEYQKNFGANLLKVRVVDPTRTQRGDLDFALSDYLKNKEKILECGANLIKRPNFEMLEIIDPNFNALLYFSNPPLSQTLKP